MEFKYGSSGKAVTAILEISERSTDQGNVFNVKVMPQCLASLSASRGPLSDSLLLGWKGPHMR